VNHEWKVILCRLDLELLEETTVVFVVFLWSEERGEKATVSESERHRHECEGVLSLIIERRSSNIMGRATGDKVVMVGVNGEDGRQRDKGWKRSCARSRDTCTHTTGHAPTADNKQASHTSE
jgi:hypothetical protein